MTGERMLAGTLQSAVSQQHYRRTQRLLLTDEARLRADTRQSNGSTPHRPHTDSVTQLMNAVVPHPSHPPAHTPYHTCHSTNHLTPTDALSIASTTVATRRVD